MFELNRIYNMDCMEAMKSIPANFFDLAICDPPYGINAPGMSMGSNRSRTKEKGGYPHESTADRMRKERGAEMKVTVEISDMPEIMRMLRRYKKITRRRAWKNHSKSERRKRAWQRWS